MNKTIVNVPENVYYISEWKEFESFIPEGHVILNKKITGCGATTYYLLNDTPLILCSHRKELLRCKYESSLNPKSELYKKDIYYFEATGDVMERFNSFKDWYKSVAYFNPFSASKCAPKILVTIDSLENLLKVLEELGIKDDFTVLSDECQCIFTDSAFKGDETIKYVSLLESFKNVIYLSATPYLETYLDKVEEFQNLPYIELKFPESSITKINFTETRTQSLRASMTEIIKRFKDFGYFEEKIKDNKTYRATQAVFFVNSVKDIKDCIKENKLKPEEVNIICANNDDNQKKLGKKYKIGKAPGRGEAHKTYTFVTKCSFEGTDFYHTNAITYIFANPNYECLALDISIDLIQIFGRQRSDENVFGKDAIMYKMVPANEVKESREEFEVRIQKKLDGSYRRLKIMDLLEGEEKEDYLSDIEDLKKVYKFSKFYVSKNDKGDYVVNKLPMLNDIRAWELVNNVYTGEYDIIRRNLEETGLIEEKDDTPFEDLIKVFSGTQDYSKRLKAYSEFRNLNPELTSNLKSLLIIPFEFHKVFEELGYDKLKSVGFNVTRTKDLKKVNDSEDKIKSAILSEFHEGDRLSKKEIKSKITKIYTDLGLTYNAKASDIEKYFETGRSQITIDGKKVEGYKLIKIK